jgi:hypothetical protein
VVDQSLTLSAAHGGLLHLLVSRTSKQQTLGARKKHTGGRAWGNPFPVLNFFWYTLPASCHYWYPFSMWKHLFFRNKQLIWDLTLESVYSAVHIYFCRPLTVQDHRPVHLCAIMDVKRWMEQVVSV